MTTQCRIIVLLALVSSFLPVCTVYAQTDPQAQDIKRYLNGQKILVSYREGGPIYGTYFFLEVHYCRTGQYALFGRNRRQTVLDNWQVNNWEEYGRWDVIRFQGQVGVQSISTSGKRDFVPVHLLPDGRLWVADGVSTQRQGTAQCR